MVMMLGGEGVVVMAAVDLAEVRCSVEPGSKVGLVGQVLRM